MEIYRPFFEPVYEPNEIKHALQARFVLNVTEYFLYGLPFWSLHFPQNDVWIFAKIKSSLHSPIHGNMGCFHVVAIVHDRKSCHLWQPGQTWRTLRKMKKGCTESRILRDPTYRRYVKWSISRKQRREWLPGAGWGEREKGSYYAQCIKFQL